MASKYTAVQYLPHPLSGELLNLGVIAWGNGQVVCHFRKDWRHVRAFGRENFDLIRRFVEHTERLISQGPGSRGIGDSFDEKKLEKHIGSWTHSIQFSEPKASLKAPPEMLEETSRIFLPEFGGADQSARDRRTAARLAAKRIRRVLIESGRLDASVKMGATVAGEFAQHAFDVVVENGAPYLVAQALSFEVQEGPQLRREIDATAWAVDDVKKKRQTLPIAIYALPPLGAESQVFSMAKHVFEGLGATVAAGEHLDEWAAHVMRQAQ